MKRAVYTMMLALAGIGCIGAQETAPPLEFQVGAGFTTGLGRTGSDLNIGWLTSGGAGYNFSPHLGAMINLNNHVLGVTPNTLGTTGVPGGTVHIFSATLDPIFHLNRSGRVDVYVTGGGGLFRRGYSPAAISTFQDISGYSTNKPGVDAGVGVAFGSKMHGKIYAEARYDRIFDSRNFYTNYLPVTLGIAGSPARVGDYSGGATIVPKGTLVAPAVVMVTFSAGFACCSVCPAS